MKTKLRKYIVELLEKELIEHGLETKFEKSSKIYDFLVASECLLIDAYENSIDKNTGITCDGEGGSIEAGFILYWLNNADTLPKLLSEVANLLAKALPIITGGSPIPKSKISPELYDKMIAQAKGAGIVASDGTIFGTGKYEQLDIGWFTSLLYYVYYQVRKDKIHPFNDTPPPPIKLNANPDNDKITKIAVVGDWGTGEYNDDGGPAVAVMDAITKLDVDYIIHLGDVYYAGTQGIIEFLGEEDDHLMDLWPKERKGKGDKKSTSFTLNSNHEMYDGANGYFEVALNQKHTPFDQQKNTSFFALEFGSWLIVGLDSAYYSPAHNLFMDGNLNGEDGAQTKWCQKLISENPDKKVIVMSHHTGVSADGTQSNAEAKFWGEVKNALNGSDPDYWYWGHIHLGVVYSDQLPTANGSKVRCVGHGSIPFGEPWGLEGIKDIDYYSKTPLGDGLRVRNGFAVIELNSEGTLSETFYEVEDGVGDPIEVWSSAQNSA